MPSAAIWWARTDLRLEDNPALAAALATGLPVQAVFVLEPELWAPERTGPHRSSFLADALRDLHAAICGLGGGLEVIQGPPARAIGGLAVAMGGAPVFTQAGHSPYARRQEAAVERAAGLVRVPPAAVAAPGVITRDDGTPFTLFAAFYRRWNVRLGTLPEPAPSPLPGQLLAGDAAGLASLPRQEQGARCPASRVEAGHRLHRFSSGPTPPAHRYLRDRERLDGAGGSALSPYLRFGLLSGLEVLRAGVAALASAPARSAATSAEAWLRENAWREHLAAQLAAWPHLTRANHDARMDRIAWRDDPDGLRAWQDGRTGYPPVDAAMRELSASGWISNRARMLAASFLVKHLLIDWRKGERHFRRLLVDAEPAANALGWQQVAGSGPGAQPWFRVLNPLAQAERFDPDNRWVRRWVQEAGSAESIAPLVEHSSARERAISVYRMAMRGERK